MSELRPLPQRPAPAYPSRLPGVLSAVKRAVAIAGLGVAVACGGNQVEPEPIPPPGVPQPTSFDTGDGQHHPDEGQAEPEPGHEGAASNEKEASSAPDRSLEWCQWQPRLSGDRMQAQHFACGASPPGSLAVQSGVPYITDGLLCGSGQPSWARYRIDSPIRARISFYPTEATLDVIAPDGTTVASLGHDRNCLALDMEAGVWTLSARRTSATNPQMSSFEIFFEAISD